MNNDCANLTYISHNTYLRSINSQSLTKDISFGISRILKTDSEHKVVNSNMNINIDMNDRSF
jgi:hypothetical protein